MPKSKFVSEYLKADHQRLDLLFTGLIESVKSGKPLDYQQSLFHLFKTGLLRHLHWEEKVLFPVYDELTGVRSGPTRTMRAEHAEMELMIIEIEKAISVGFDVDYLSALSHFLDAHNEKEEKILYPAIDHVCKGDAQEQIAIAISQGYR